LTNRWNQAVPPTSVISRLIVAQRACLDVPFTGKAEGRLLTVQDEAQHLSPYPVTTVLYKRGSDTRVGHAGRITCYLRTYAVTIVNMKNPMVAVIWFISA